MSSADHLDRSFTIPKSVAVVESGQGKGKIYLVGCLHGAPTSCRDVAAVVDGCCGGGGGGGREDQGGGDGGLGAVVLELCPSRYEALTREMRAEKASALPETKEIIQKWAKGVAKVYRERGAGPALLGGFLSFTYVLQKVAKFDPGTEFKKAVAMGADQGFNIVLGDAEVNATIASFSRGLGDFGDITATNALRDFGVMVEALFGGRPFFGIGAGGVMTSPQYINVPMVLTTTPQLVKDLFVLLAPITFVVYGVTDTADYLIGQAFGGIQSANAAVATSAPYFEAGSEAINFLTLAFTGLFTSKFFRLIIAERNEFLAASIEEAYRSDPSKDTIAVLGMLHCNGVAKILGERLSSFSDSDDKINLPQQDSYDNVYNLQSSAISKQRESFELNSRTLKKGPEIWADILPREGEEYSKNVF